MECRKHPITIPDLGLGSRPLTVSLWLVDEGGTITQGERILEISSPGVTVDLPAPASGVLVRILVGEDEPVVVGQTVGVIEEAP